VEKSLGNSIQLPNRPLRCNHVTNALKYFLFIAITDHIEGIQQPQ